MTEAKTPAQPASVSLLDAVARTLNRSGVTRVFAMLGAGSAGWIGIAERDDLFRYVGTRHEAAAVVAACGFARVSGTVGVASVSCGPGLANALGALTCAVRDRAPIVVLVSEVPVDSLRNQAQVIDQVALVGPTGAAVRRVDQAGQLAGAIRAAVLQAWHEQAPQVVTYDEAMMDAMVSEPEAASPDGDVAAAAPSQALDVAPRESSDAIHAALELLRSARNPLVLAGRGVLLADAAEQAAALADDLGALLCTTIQAHHLFDGHPWSIGFAGGWARPLTRELVDAADCVLVLGASLNRYTTDGETLFARQTVIQCDADPSAFGRHLEVDLAIAGQLGSSIAALRRGLDAPSRPDSGPRTPELASRLVEYRWYSPLDDLSGPEGLDPRAVLDRLDNLLPDDRIVVSDVGRWSALLPGMMHVRDPRSLVLTLGFASIGHGLGAALGAAVAAPGRRTVLVAGDGGFGMSAQELAAVQRAGVDLTVVVLDDGQFGAEVPSLAAAGLGPEVAAFPGPDYVRLAQAYGGTGRVVSSSEELAALTTEMLIQPGLTLIDARINPHINSRQFLRAEPDPYVA